MRVPRAQESRVQSVNRQREIQRSSAAIASKEDAAAGDRSFVCDGQKVACDSEETISTEIFWDPVFSTGGRYGVGSLTLPHWQLIPHWHDEPELQHDSPDEALLSPQQVTGCAVQQQPPVCGATEEQHVEFRSPAGTSPPRSPHPQALTCMVCAGMASTASHISVRAMRFVEVSMDLPKPDVLSSVILGDNDALDVYRLVLRVTVAKIQIRTRAAHAPSTASCNRLSIPARL